MFFGSEGIVTAIQCTLDSVSEFFGDLISDIFVIDEYPYLAKAEKSISSRLQHIIDHVWQNSQLFLILCGSSMSFMEYQVLGYESPLYGRRTAQFKIEALKYREIASFLPKLTPEQLSLIYDIMNRRYIDDVLQDSRNENEHSALISMLENIGHESIIVADRGYESYNTIAHLENNGLKYVMRIKTSGGIAHKFNIPHNEEADFTANIIITR
ncbi:MAG: transposase, partial [Crenarchaeota archaeon]|nr:transposase [Thermoproteota archaeon]